MRARTLWSRRVFLHGAGALALCTPLGAQSGAATAAEASVDLAHAELWRRFVDKYGIVLDETALDGTYLRPTPEECRLGKPNAVGWLTPIANGAMYTGLYMDAMVNRAITTGADADMAKVQRLVDGLLLLSDIGGAKGFIARGPATDGKTTYALGSNDQTMPWLYGLWRYIRSGLADAERKRQLTTKMAELAAVLEGTGWRMPALKPFGYRGSFAEPGWDGAPRLLFLLKAMHTLTADVKWKHLYERSLHETGVLPEDGAAIPASSRLAACAAGVASRPKQQMWTGSVSNACLRELWELEEDQTLRSVYARGLLASAEFAAAEKLPLAREFDHDSGKRYDIDWRKLNPLWRPQRSSAEATEVSLPQRELKNALSPRAQEESSLVREPAFAAWIIALCPDREVLSRHRNAVLDTIAHFQSDRLHLSTFFALESAWWRLRSAV